MTDTEILESVLRQAASTPVSELPQFLGRLETARVTALARLSAPAAVAPMADDWLDAKEAARRLHCSRSFLYHRKTLPFTRRVGKKLVYSARGIEAYLASGKPFPPADE